MDDFTSQVLDILASIEKSLKDIEKHLGVRRLGNGTVISGPGITPHQAARAWDPKLWAEDMEQAERNVEESNRLNRCAINEAADLQDARIKVSAQALGPFKSLD